MSASIVQGKQRGWQWTVEVGLELRGHLRCRAEQKVWYQGGRGEKGLGLARWQAQDTEGLVSTLLGGSKSMCQGPEVEASLIWLEQSCRASRAESKGRSAGGRVRRLGNREPAKDFGQERDIMKLVLLESSLINSGKKCQDILLVSTFLSIQTVLQWTPSCMRESMERQPTCSLVEKQLDELRLIHTAAKVNEATLCVSTWMILRGKKLKVGYMQCTTIYVNF